MRNKNAVKENQARRRLLRFSLLTLGGAGLEGSTQHLAGKEEGEESDKKVAVMAA